MLEFVTKKKYWEAEDAGMLKLLPQKYAWHLKTIQDVVALHHLIHLKNKAIAEIGGGDSRVLEVLKKHNHCANIDEFKGAANGPSGQIVINGVRNISANVGEFSTELNDREFDAIFSISVIEHIPAKSLQDFFTDSLRILRPGGKIIHLIDVYIEDDDKGNEALKERIRLYLNFLEMDQVEDEGGENNLVPENVRFSCSFATNPDSMMKSWNRIAPRLVEKRERSQSCTLLLVARKQAAG